MPFAVSHLVTMVILLRDCYLALHMERHLPRTVSQRQPLESTPTAQEWHCLKQVGKDLPICVPIRPGNKAAIIQRLLYDSSHFSGHPPLTVPSV